MAVLTPISYDSKEFNPNFFHCNFQSIESDELDQIKKIPGLESMKELLFFQIIDDEDYEKEIPVIIHNVDKDDVKNFTASQIQDYVFPYYDEEDLKIKCQELIDKNKGFVLSYFAARLLGISEISENMSITFTAYVPIATKTAEREHEMGISDINGVMRDYRGINIRYVQKEITLPIIGIVDQTDIAPDECFGYIDYEYMKQLWSDLGNQDELGPKESRWKANSYAIVLDENTTDISKEVYQINPCLGVSSFKDFLKPIPEKIAFAKSLRPLMIGLIILSISVSFLFRKKINKTKSFVSNYFTIAILSLVSFTIIFMIARQYGVALLGHNKTNQMITNILFILIFSLFCNLILFIPSNKKV